MRLRLGDGRELEVDTGCEALVVQQPLTVQWASAEQAAAAVSLCAPTPSCEAWRDWVERAGGSWASAPELAGV